MQNNKDHSIIKAKWATRQDSSLACGGTEGMLTGLISGKRSGLRVILNIFHINPNSILRVDNNTKYLLLPFQLHHYGPFTISQILYRLCMSGFVQNNKTRGKKRHKSDRGEFPPKWIASWLGESPLGLCGWAGVVRGGTGELCGACS